MAPPPTDQEFPYFRATLALLIGLTLFRFWYCTTLGLVGDEAYYWVCSKHLDLSFFDKGPGAAATIAAGTHLFGDTVFGIRFFAVLLSLGTGLGLYALAKTLFNERVAWLTVLIASAVPLFAVGSILMTIDPLSVFFWTMASLCFWHAKDTHRLGAWILVGALIGLGGLAKYTNLVELLCFALFCLCCAPYRRQLLRPPFYAMLGAALVCMAPIWIWNARHHWVTVVHLVHRGAMDGSWHFSPGELASFLAIQAGVISPLLFLGIMGALFGPKLDPSLRLQVRFLLCLFLPLFLFYLALSANKAGQANWTAPSYVAGIILFAAVWDNGGRERRWVRWFGLAALGVAILETVLLHNTRWLHLPPGKDPMDRSRGYDALAQAASGIAAKEGTQVYIANKYMLASLLCFYLPGRPETYMPPTDTVTNQYSIWPGYRALPPGSSALFVSDKERIPTVLRMDFVEVRHVATIRHADGNRTLKEHYLYLCRELRNAAPSP